MEEAPTPHTQTTQPSNAYQRSILAIAPKLTKGGTFMKETAPRASLPPNPDGFWLSPGNEQGRKAKGGGKYQNGAYR